MTQHGDIETYLDLDEDELYETLGALLLGGGLGMATADPDQHAEYGRQWFKAHLAELRQRLCGNPGLAVVRNGEIGDPLMQVATISDCLASFAGRPAAAVLAAIVLRIGLDSLCRSHQ